MTWFYVQIRESRPSDKWGVYLMIGMCVVISVIFAYGFVTGNAYA